MERERNVYTTLSLVLYTTGFTTQESLANATIPMYETIEF